MEFDIYCDESHPDLLSTKEPLVKYIVIGSVWLKTYNRDKFKNDIHSLRDKYKVGPEFKWLKVSKSRIEFYKDLVKLFISKGNDLVFRCIVVDNDKVNLKFHEHDQELGFYKFYYQLLNPWIEESNEYKIFCNYKSNRRRDRLHVLRNCLVHSNKSADILSVQATRSKESVLLQLADLLTGIVSAELNETSMTGSAKDDLLRFTAQMLGKEIEPTSKMEYKFNISRIKTTGGE